ncbi:MAG TPA: DUF6587 family protein [Paraburkholderia sp.]|jgi:hypothetical protein|nr:DUF6587 family protein [Paraburkholderia sp.]
MNVGLVVQYAVIGLLVVASAVYMLRRLAPTLTTRGQAALAGRLLKPGRTRFAQRVGRALQPRAATGNCGDGCGTCGSCGTGSDAGQAAGTDEKPLTFQPYRRS